MNAGRTALALGIPALIVSAFVAFEKPSVSAAPSFVVASAIIVAAGIVSSRPSK